MSGIESFIDWSMTNWYLYVILALMFVYSKFKDKEKIGKMELKEMKFVVQIGFILIAIYLIQTKLFSEHNYFLLSLPIWLLIWGFAINYILSQNDIYVVETPLMGEKFYDVLNGKEIMSLSTDLKILKMDNDFYNAKKHIGETNNPLLSLSSKIKFADMYDKETGIFYHSVYPQLQNINFYTRIATWLKLKEDLPKIVDENIVHTWLEGFKLADKIQTLEPSFAYQLSGIRELTDIVPYKLHDSLEEYMELVKSAKSKDTNEIIIKSDSDKKDSENSESNKTDGDN